MGGASIPELIFFERLVVFKGVAAVSFVNTVQVARDRIKCCKCLLLAMVIGWWYTIG